MCFVVPVGMTCSALSVAASAAWFTAHCGTGTGYFTVTAGCGGSPTARVVVRVGESTAAAPTHEMVRTVSKVAESMFGPSVQRRQISVCAFPLASALKGSLLGLSPPAEHPSLRRHRRFLELAAFACAIRVAPADSASGEIIGTGCLVIDSYGQACILTNAHYCVVPPPRGRGSPNLRFACRQSVGRVCSTWRSSLRAR